MLTRMLLPNKETYRECVKLIREGELVAFPTETVYGLGANALNTEAVKKIFIAKGRPSDNPLIVHVADTENILQVAREITPVAEKLIKNFMPGPVTIILNKKPCISDVVSGGLATVGVRIPSNTVARDFLKECNVPVAAPSANTSTRPSPTKAMHVYEDLKGRIPAIIDGGNCDIGIESTVIDATGDYPIILRPGKVTLADIKEIFPDAILSGGITDGVIKSPGVKYRHYAPQCECAIINSHNKEFIFKVYNNQLKSGKNPVLLCFKNTAKSLDSLNIINLGKDNNEAAASFFRALREGEKKSDIILVEICQEGGIKESLLNRMIKSAGGNVIEE